MAVIRADAMEYRNPIIPGYHPDPSICRVGNDYYLVNSTFEFFPGVPIFHSRNLVNWDLVSYALTRRSQLELEGCRNSGGIYAPSIRYHDGMFYMITTNVTWKGNFIVHSPSIEGPWSEPAWVDQDGIDPSLFWDDDGTCYYCSTGRKGGVKHIWAFAIDPLTGEILSEKHPISTGCGGPATEGPHIYKVNGWYYLMMAEGGTEYQHHEVITRSRHVFGPYEPCPYNPILAHKSRKGHEIQATGHADLVEDQNGNWWCVFLAYRNFSKALLHNLGRETFLAPVHWTEDGWPIVGDGGHVELKMDGPLPQQPEPVCHDIQWDFSSDKMDLRFEYTRNPDMANYTLDPGSGTLTLTGTEVTLSVPCSSPTILSTQQPSFFTETVVAMDAAKTSADRAGISAFYNNDYHYDLYLSRRDRKLFAGFTKAIHDMTVEIARVPLETEDDEIRLIMKTDREKYSFYVQAGQTEPLFMGSGHNAGLSTEGTKTMTFTGTMIAMFAEKGQGVFRSFSMKELPDPAYE